MSYRQDNRSYKGWWWALVFIACVAIVLVSPSIRSGVTGTLYRIGIPLWSMNASFGETAKKLDLRLYAKPDLIEKINTLQEKNDVLSALLIDRERLIVQNIHLRSLLREGENENLISTARVLVSADTMIGGGLIIAVGENAGVQKGDSVIVEGGLLLGRVSEVWNATSRVTLVTDPNVQTSIMIPAYEISTTMNGRGAGNARMSLPRDIVVKENIPVFDRLSGLVVGMLISVDEDPREPVKDVIVRSPVNIQNVMFVSLIRTPEIPDEAYQNSVDEEVSEIETSTENISV